MNEIIQTSGFTIESLLRGMLGIASLLLIAFAFFKKYLDNVCDHGKCIISGFFHPEFAWNK